MSEAERRVVAITGGTQGIGRAIADLFQSRGYAVAVCSRSRRDPDLPVDFLHRCVDVRSREQQRAFVADVVKQFGGLDVFVNNAGVSRWRALEEIDEAFVTEVLETNVLGTLWGCAAAAEALDSDGCIVTISSLAGKRGSPNNSTYCAAKFAVNGITQSLAKELGPRGIRVNAVCPVYVETQRILSALADSASPAMGRPVDKYLAEFAATQAALGRLPSKQELAEVVYFLGNPVSSAITGQCINVDCGVFPQ